MKGRSLNTEIHAEDEDILKQLVDENELNPFQDVKDYFDDDEAHSDKNPLIVPSESQYNLIMVKMMLISCFRLFSFISILM